MKIVCPHFRKTTLVLALSAALVLPFNSYATAIGGEFQIDIKYFHEQRHPDVASDANGNFIVVYASKNIEADYDIYARRYNSSGMPLGTEFRVNTTSVNNQNGPSVALDADGDATIVWFSDRQDGSGSGVYAQRFNKAGARVGGEFRVNTTTSGDQSGATVALDADGDAVIAWVSKTDNVNSDSDVYAQRFNNLGTRVGGEFRVNTATADHQIMPTVALDDDGDAVITWASYIQGILSSSIHAQRYNNSGAPIGGEFQVNTTLLGYPSPHAIAIDADGDFIIVWESIDQDDNDYDILAQRYNNAGMPNGGEFRVNSTITGSQVYPDVAYDADGDTIITWTGYTAVSKNYDILAQIYNNARVPIGGEFLVNTTHTNKLYDSAVALDANGDAVVVWEIVDRFSYDIYAQRYTSIGAGIIGSCGGVTATIAGTTGPDILTGTADNDVIAGMAGNDTISGLGGNDLLCGSQGDDRILGGPGNDLIRGTEGIDTVVFGGASGVTANLPTGTATGEGSDTLELIENITGTSAADTLTGDGLNNILTGGGGNDRLNGAGGTDTASFEGTAGVTVNLGTGTATGQGSDTLSNLENVTGSNGNDNLIGNSGNNILNGGTGNDTLNGGAGNDSINGETGTDTVSFTGTAAVTVNLATGTATGQGSDTISNLENVTGSNGNDTLTGNTGNNVLTGNSGNDTLNGGGRNDSLNGGAGTDTCNGQDGTGDSATACETVTGVP